MPDVDLDTSAGTPLRDMPEVGTVEDKDDNDLADHLKPSHPPGEPNPSQQSLDLVSISQDRESH